MLNQRDKILVELLKSKRVEQNIKQIELSAKLCKTQSYVSKYENNERKLSFIETIDICNAIGINLNSLYIELMEKFHESHC